MTLAQLRALCEAATPGKDWRYSPWHIEEGPAVVRGAGYGIVCGNFASDDTAKYVAALSPARILALLDALDAAKEIRTAKLLTRHQKRSWLEKLDAALAKAEAE
jgi:hypothetical protein